MHQYNIASLIQIMACCLFGAKPLSDPMLPYCQLDPKEQISVEFYSKIKNFIQENTLENVTCKMAAITSQTCVTSSVGNSHRSTGPRPTTLEED